MLDFMPFLGINNHIYIKNLPSQDKTSAYSSKTKIAVFFIDLGKNSKTDIFSHKPRLLLKKIIKGDDFRTQHPQNR